MATRKTNGGPVLVAMPLLVVLLCIYLAHTAGAGVLGGGTSAPSHSSSKSGSNKPNSKPSNSPTRGGKAPSTTPASCPDAASLANIPRNYREVFLEAGHAYHVNPLFLAALYLTENGNNWRPFDYPWPTSDADAHGPMQFIPGTWNDYKTSPHADWNNMHDAVFAAANLISRATNASSALGSLSQPLEPGTILREAAAYNAGPGTVANLGSHGQLWQLSTQTQNYLKNVHELFVSHFTRSGHPYYRDPAAAHDNPATACS